VRSVRRAAYRAGLLAFLVLLLAVAASGCQTTQETAALKQAESKRILEKREQKRRSKAHDHGSKKR
jgi:hypothetical protein